jgi:hypothetical protein
LDVCVPVIQQWVRVSVDLALTTVLWVVTSRSSERARKCDPDDGGAGLTTGVEEPTFLHSFAGKLLGDVYTLLITPRYIVIVKLTVVQPLKKFPVFYEILKFEQHVRQEPVTGSHRGQYGSSLHIANLF